MLEGYSVSSAPWGCAEQQPHFYFLSCMFCLRAKRFKVSKDTFVLSKDPQSTQRLGGISVL